MEGDGVLIDGSASALGVLIQAQYEAGSKRIVIAKKRLHPDFFLFSTGLAGEVLKKYVNYAGNPCGISDWKAIRAGTFSSSRPCRKPLIG